MPLWVDKVVPRLNSSLFFICLVGLTWSSSVVIKNCCKIGGFKGITANTTSGLTIGLLLLLQSQIVRLPHPFVKSAASRLPTRPWARRHLKRVGEVGGRDGLVPVPAQSLVLHVDQNDANRNENHALKLKGGKVLKLGFGAVIVVLWKKLT